MKARIDQPLKLPPYRSTSRFVANGGERTPQFQVHLLLTMFGERLGTAQLPTAEKAARASEKAAAT